MLPKRFTSWEDLRSVSLDELLKASRELSWKNLGKELQLFIPGKMTYMKEKGKYPTISITGKACALNCDHCQRTILGTMEPATTPERLVELCKRMDSEGEIGVLISGGSKKDGTLAWECFFDAIRKIKDETKLKISIHTGLIDHDTAAALKDAGVDEMLIDVIGSEETMSKVYHLDSTMEEMDNSLAALESTGLPLIPHIVVGLHYGEIKGEMEALEMVSRHNPYALVVVVLIPLKGSPMEKVSPPEPEDVARFIACARFRLPEVPIALSCARPPGKKRERLDELAVEAGVNRIAMPAETAIQKAKEYGLTMEFFKTCCSKSY